MTPELPCDPPLQTTRLRGGSFTWCESGEGPVLLAVHGAPGSVRDFRWLASATSGVRFIRLDMPGYRRNLARLRCSTLVAWAEDDRLVESAVSRELAEAAPAGPRLPFETGGHNLQKTCAVEIGEALAALVGRG